MSVNVYDPVNDKLIPVAGATLFADASVGSIIAFAGKETNLPEGYLAFNGQTVKRGDYPDLWAFAVANEQVGVDKFFSQGDGATTFTLADLRETSLKGYGETSRSVGAHVKSGGLGIGEFIDDQLQNITGSFGAYSFSNGGSDGVISSTIDNPNIVAGNNPSSNYNYVKFSLNASRVARTGSTTEVKAVGVVWAVKARMTGLPIDLKEQMENYVTSFPMFIGEWLFTESGSEDEATLFTFTVPKDGKLKYIGKDISKVSESYSLFFINNFTQVPFGSSMNEVSVTKGSTIIISRQKNAIGDLTVYLV